jgi:hypothetical protein
MQSQPLGVQTAFFHLSQSYSPKDCQLGNFPAKSGISSCDDDDDDENNNNNTLWPPGKKRKTFA